MNKLTLLTLLILCGIIVSCRDESDLRKSIFIADENKPGLPQYSEWGYNTFGAYYDRIPFTSESATTPGKVNVNNGITELHFQGQKDGRELRLIITVPGINPDAYDDLVELHKTTIDLASDDVYVLIGEAYPTLAHVLEGQLIFSRAQLLLVDGTPFEVILSGRFEMKVELDGNPVSISDGRFDVGISKYTFFKY